MCPVRSVTYVSGRSSNEPDPTFHFSPAPPTRGGHVVSSIALRFRRRRFAVSQRVQQRGSGPEIVEIRRVPGETMPNVSVIPVIDLGPPCEERRARSVALRGLGRSGTTRATIAIRP
jgi:hypothetical protein